MTKREYLASITSFRSACSTLKSLVGHGGDGSALDTEISSWRLTTVPLSQLADDDQVGVGASCNTFRRCFLIMPMPCNEKVPTTDKFALLAASLLYNIALAHHLIGFTNAEGEVRHLNKAMKLYRKASELLHRLETTSDGAALMLATANNMASVSLSTMDLKAFLTYRNMMNRFLSITTTTGSFHCAFFAGNLTANSSAHQRPAPAA